MPMLAAEAACGHRSSPSSSTVLDRWSLEVRMSASGYCRGGSRSCVGGRYQDRACCACKGCHAALPASDRPRHSTWCTPHLPRHSTWCTPHPPTSPHLLHVRQRVAQPHGVHIWRANGRQMGNAQAYRCSKVLRKHAASHCCVSTQADHQCLGCPQPPASSRAPLISTSNSILVKL